MGRPVAMTAASAVLMLALATSVLHLRIGLTDITGFPSSVDGVAGILLINQKWPQGTDLRLDVVVTEPDREDTRVAIERLEVEALQIPGLSGPPQERFSQDRHAALVSFTMGGERNDEANRAIVRRVRNELRPQIFGGLAEVRAYVSG